MYILRTFPWYILRTFRILESAFEMYIWKVHLNDHLLHIWKVPWNVHQMYILTTFFGYILITFRIESCIFLLNIYKVHLLWTFDVHLRSTQECEQIVHFGNISDAHLQNIWNRRMYISDVHLKCAFLCTFWPTIGECGLLRHEEDYVRIKSTIVLLICTFAQLLLSKMCIWNVHLRCTSQMCFFRTFW